MSDHNTAPVKGAKSQNITFYIDGSCRPENPGGYACWAYEAVNETGRAVARDFGCAGNGPGMTNNIAEYHALIHALERASQEAWPGCTIKSDSQLIVKQANGEWKCNQSHLFELMQTAVRLMAELGATLVWIPREQNERADHLSDVAYNKARQVV